jgi:hypothetical protein
MVTTADLAVWLDGVRVWTTGFECIVSFARRHAAAAYDWRPDFVRYASDDGSSLATVEVVYADGRTSADAGRTWAEDGMPIGPVITFRPGLDGLRRTEERLFVWPLPPPEPVTFRLSWPAGGVAMVEAQIDGAALRTAAGQVEHLWPERIGRPPATATPSSPA